MVGPREDEIYDKLAKRLLFDHTSEEAESNLEELIGMEFWRDPKPAGGLEHIVMHQYRYTKMIVEEYEAKHNGGRPLKPLYTPLLAREEKGSEEQAGEHEDPPQVPKDVPDLFASKEEHGGKFGWIARGTRPDVCVAQRKISTRYHCWNRLDDAMVHRVYRYLKATLGLGIGIWAHPEDLSSRQLLVSLRTDSDHANDTTTTKSVAGGRTVVRGVRGTWIPFSWWARRMGQTSRNTGEAETTALDIGTFEEAIPLQGILEELLGNEIRVIAEVDNTACIGAVAKGFSRKLAYLKKARRVSLGALHEYYVGDGNPERKASDEFTVNRLHHRSGETNDADLLTKGFPYDRHWELCTRIGMSHAPAEELEKIERLKRGGR